MLHTHECTYVCMHVCILYVCMYVYDYTCMHTCMHARMHACMHGWMDGWMDGRSQTTSSNGQLKPVASLRLASKFNEHLQLALAGNIGRHIVIAVE